MWFFILLDDDALIGVVLSSTQDMYIFLGGAVFTFFCFYLIWSYLG